MGTAVVTAKTAKEGRIHTIGHRKRAGVRKATRHRQRQRLTIQRAPTPRNDASLDWRGCHWQTARRFSTFPRTNLH